MQDGIAVYKIVNCILLLYCFHKLRAQRVCAHLLLIDIHIKIGDSSFKCHATSTSCEPELQIYLIMSQQIASLSQCELRCNKFASFEPTTL